MKFRLCIIILALAGISASLFGSEPESFTVNGLKVIFRQNTASDIVVASMFFRGGSTVLPNNEAGLEKFALSVAVKATEHYPKDSLNATLEKMNTSITTSATLDYSSIDLQCVKQYFPASWDVFADILLHPLIAKEDVELERQEILSRIKQTHDNPDAYLTELGRMAFYTDHPYETSIDGDEATVSSFTPVQLKSYLTSRTTTSQMLLVVVGNVTRAEIEKMVGSSFESLQVGRFDYTAPPAVRHEEPSLKIVQRSLPTNYIVGYFPAPAFGSDEYYAISIASAVLRDRLFEEVRTKRALSYAPASGVAGNFSNYGYIYVTAVKPDTTISVMITELKKLINDKFTSSEMLNSVNVFVTNYYLRNETNRSQASLLGRYELSGAGFLQADKFIEYVKKVTPDDIQNVCKKYIKNLQFVVIGNPESIEVKNFMF